MSIIILPDNKINNNVITVIINIIITVFIIISTLLATYHSPLSPHLTPGNLKSVGYLRK